MLEGSKRRLAALGCAALALAVAHAAVFAQTAERSGKQVVESVCASCHGSGANGAPRIGERKAWAERAARGLTSLTENAIHGIRNMPAHGGSPGLSDLEIARAVTYMVNQSGGRWAEPIDPAAPAAERSGEQVVKAQCSKCHETGKGGAPRMGDRAAWTPRLKYGLDSAVRSAIRGHGGMPARGGLAELTDGEVRAAVVYMFNPGAGAAPAGSPAAQGAAEANHRIVGGTEIFLGVMPAQALRAQQRAGGTLHGKIPRGKDYYHVNVSLYDAATRAQIRDAEVSVRVASPLGGDTKKLEAMAINDTVSYGNYFRMPAHETYAIEVTVRRPGAAPPVEARFEHKH